MENKTVEIDSAVSVKKCLICGRDGGMLLSTANFGDLMKCRRCGLVFRLREPKESVLVYNNPSDSLEEFADQFYRASIRVMDYILKRAAKYREAPGDFLDVGSGTGRMLRAAREAGWSARGVEINEADIAVSRKFGFDVFPGTLAQFNPPAGSYDAISFIEVCEFFPDPVAEIRSAAKALKPGGVIMFRVFNASVYLAIHRIFNRYGFVLNKLGLCDPSMFHFFAFPARTFRLCLEQAGLRVEEICPSPSNKSDAYDNKNKPFTKRLIYALFPVFERFTRLLFSASGKRILLSPAYIAICSKHPEPDKTHSASPLDMDIAGQYDSRADADNTRAERAAVNALCSSCKVQWDDIPSFSSDPSVKFVGMQINLDVSDYQCMYIFNHNTCGATFALSIGKFKNMIKEPIPASILTGERACPQYCLDVTNLLECDNECRNAPFRRLAVRNLQKTNSN